MPRKHLFSRFASRMAIFAGRPATFIAACVMIGVWAAAGFAFGFSDAWQLTINTGTTIVTFLMVFIIQNTQNREGRALQIKIDELIRATRHAHNALLDLEELSEQELETFRQKYAEIARAARQHRLKRGGEDGVPVIDFEFPGKSGEAKPALPDPA
jgi:low affinity Fe/Cu permease